MAWGTPGQLVGGTVWGQLARFLLLPAFKAESLHKGIMHFTESEKEPKVYP